MKRTAQFTVTSLLDSPAEAVWKSVSTMRGVNEELAPFLKMTYPKQAEELSLADAPLRQKLFASVILLGGFIPADLHMLRLENVDEGKGFHENSTTMIQKQWVHKRTLEPMGDQCRVTDRVTFTPRMPGLAAIMEMPIKKLFEHRHRVLRKKFGGS